MNNKYKLYHNKIDKVFHNNKEIYMSNTKEDYNNSIDVRKKINEIINDSSFIYRTRVNILVGNDILSKKVVGVIGNDLITIDGEHILIDSIRDIYK